MLEPKDAGATFAALGLASWPFQLVPLAGPTSTWYDRTDLKADVDRLLWRLSRQAYSTLHLLWADVGSGKTHTLRYIEYAAPSQVAGVSTLYAVMPKRSRSFVDLYSTVSRSFDLDEAAIALAALKSANGSAALEDAIGDWPDLHPALVYYQTGSLAERDLIRRWISGSRDVRRSDLSRAGISREVKTADQAVAALTALTTLLLSKKSRLIVLIDEMQRVGTVKGAIANEISAGLHTWFNAVPERLTFVLTFSFGDPAHIAAHVTPELLSRVDHQRLEMRPLSITEAVAFVSEAIESNKLPGVTETALTGELIKSGVAALASSSVLSPRNVMKAFDAVLTEIDFRTSTGASPFKVKDIAPIVSHLSLDVGWEAD